MTVTHDGEILTPAEVERNILRICDELDEMIVDLANAADTAKRSEVAWKRAAAKVRIMRRPLPGNGPGGRTTEGDVEDSAMDKHGDLYEAYKINEGVYEALRDAMFTKRTQIDALRTIAANIRAAT